MLFALPDLRVGEHLCHEGLSVFPLFSAVRSDVDYHLSDVALADKSVLVEEVSTGGAVPDLLVENKGGVRVLFLEGEELVGAKQNRILNTTVLVAAHAKIKIPVSCVEQGRWGYKSRYFETSGSHSPSKLRRALKASVSRSVKQHQSHQSDQGEVWKEVACLHATHGVASETTAMSDAFYMYEDRINEFRDRLRYVDGAVGVAVAIGNRVISIDVFDKPSTCRKVWERLLSGVVFDVLEASGGKQHLTSADVEDLLACAADFAWEASVTVGEGVEFRAQSKRGDHASALAVESTVVHASVVFA